MQRCRHMNLRLFVCVCEHNQNSTADHLIDQCLTVVNLSIQISLYWRAIMPFWTYSATKVRIHTYQPVPAGSPSCGGDVVVYVFYINQVSLPTQFYSVLVSISVFVTLSTVFPSINSPNNSPLSHYVLPILFQPYWSFQLYISSWKSPSALM